MSRLLDLVAAMASSRACSTSIDTQPPVNHFIEQLPSSSKLPVLTSMWRRELAPASQLAT
ncbi:hypothetical protein Zm00014a_013665 [Zea mays]|uniref:Uncharacterized protein n=1 Tax=Zea mays TaxID=4577 RepID=A0A3L6E4E1_MAIZE|nr:hypothetical protein Zm00014a_013665 [Zea mays]